MELGTFRTEDHAKGCPIRGCAILIRLKRAQYVTRIKLFEVNSGLKSLITAFTPYTYLPSEISSLDSLPNFKCHVKTFLFKQAFNSQQSIYFVYFIIYHLISFYFIFKSFYLLVNFTHFQSLFFTYCKAHLIMCHGKLRCISFNYYHYIHNPPLEV